MPAASRYSAATRDLVEELRARGYVVGCRGVEQWAAWGLAPAPERISLGRHGSTSRYPPGAVEQYAAVASVMRRGQDWRTTGLILIGRGHLIAKEATFRLLLDYLFSSDDDVEDPLQFADDQVAAASRQPLFKRMARIVKSNISAARISDPVTGTMIDAETAAPAVMTRGLASLLGEPMPRDAAEEMAAAWGLIDSATPPEVREHRIDFVEAMSRRIMRLDQLAETARTADPIRLQMTVRTLRQEAANQPEQVLQILPPEWADILMIALALATIMIDDLGGIDWFEQISPGLRAAEAQHQAER